MTAKLLPVILGLLLVVLSQSARADSLTVVTSLGNDEALDLDQVARIFLGKTAQYPSGAPVIALNLDPGDPRYVEFCQRVLKKTPNQLKAYWARRVFTGRGKPPPQVDSARMQALLVSDRRYLGYLDRLDSQPRLRRVIVLD